jgi:2,4-dienoyl-CoA reductase-like NADH-dependent reductase (Old Yellow Enzyme family)
VTQPGAVAHPLLFSPLAVGPMTVPNRIVCAPHQTEFSPDARFTDQHVAYLERRARGGAGWIVTEPVEAHPTSRREVGVDGGGWSTAVLPSWRALREAVHAHGARVSLTVGHAGPNTTGVESGRALWGPSAVPSPGPREVPAAMTTAMIDELLESLGTVAANARDAGFDGVELQVTADYLFGAFLSPLTNHRDDGYGGDLDGRGRIVLEAVARLREATRGELAVGLRISADHLVEGGLRPDEASQVLARCAAEGTVDYVSVIQGTYHTLDHIIPSMGTPVAPAAAAAAEVRAATGVPVAVAGRIPDAATMEELIARGDADLVATARLLDDDVIRRCLYCNQLCVTQLLKRKPIRCVQNPEVGRESSGVLTPLTSGAASGRRRVVVVGAGPAGLEAACTLDAVGCEVRVIERADAPGGRLRLAWQLPGRAELRHAVEPRVAALSRAGVPLGLGTEATAEVLADLAPDAVVLATGAVPDRRGCYRGAVGRMAIAGLADVRVLVPDDVAAGVEATGPVIVVDEEGTRAIAAVIEALAEQVAPVIVVTTLPHLGYPQLVLSQQWATTVPPLLHRGVVVHPFSRLRSVSGGRAVIARIDDGTETAIEGVSTLVLAMGGLAPDPPDLGRPVVLVGDALAPRDLGAAILDGRRLAREVGAVLG